MERNIQCHSIIFVCSRKELISNLSQIMQSIIESRGELKEFRDVPFFVMVKNQETSQSLTLYNTRKMVYSCTTHRNSGI